MEDSDSEYETEEAVVLVELNGIIDSNFLLQQQMPAKILGIETDQPILQIGHYVFSGEYEDTMGTVVAYDSVQLKGKDGAMSENYKFLCKTDKKLSMKRVFLQEKDDLKASSAELSSNCAYSENAKAVTEHLENTCPKNGQEIENLISVARVSNSETAEIHSRKIQSQVNTSSDDKSLKIGDKLKSRSSKKQMVLGKNSQALKNNSSNLCNSKNIKSDGVVSEVSHLIDCICTEVTSKCKSIVFGVSSETESNVKQPVKENINSSRIPTLNLMSRNECLSKKRKSKMLEERGKKVCKLSSDSDPKSAVIKTVKMLVKKVENVDASSASSSTVEGDSMLPDDSSCKKGDCTSSSNELKNGHDTCLSLSSQKSKIAVKSDEFSVHEVINTNNEVFHPSDDMNEDISSATHKENIPPCNVSGSDSINQLVESSTDKIKYYPASVEINLNDKCSSSGDNQYFNNSVQPAFPDACQSSDNESTSCNFEKKKSNGGCASSSTGDLIRSDVACMDNVTSKTAMCEVSQSSKGQSNSKCSSSEYDLKNSNECEMYEFSSDPSVEDPCDSHVSELKYNYPSTSTEGNELLSEDQLLGQRKEYEMEEKLSFCEVSQSNGSKRLHENDKCEVSQNYVDQSVASSSKHKDKKNKNSRSTFSKKIKPEVSLSEVSQSHKCQRFSPEHSKCMEYEGEELNQSEICSQSSDLSSKSVKSLYENKDMCVSSCDSKKSSITTQLPSTSSMYKANHNAACEVSQSDKYDELCATSEPYVSGNREVSNECTFSSNISQEENMKSSVDSCTDKFPYSSLQTKKKFAAKIECKDSCEVSQSFKHDVQRVTGSSSEAEMYPEDRSALVLDGANERNSCEPSRQQISNSEICAVKSGDKVQNSSCEVSQSFSCEKQCCMLKVCSNECENYQWGDEPQEQVDNTLNQSSKDLCASSDDVNKSIHSGIKQIEDVRDLVCEVSQSFELAENDIVSEAPCVSSDSINTFSAENSAEETGNDVKNLCEVSQSSRPENSSISNPNARGSNEHDISCFAPEVLKEACVSSDDVKGVRFKNQKKLGKKSKDQHYSCEVTQSYKSSKTDSCMSNHTSINAEIEGSSECDVCDQTQDILSTQVIDPSFVESKETCVSSNDISVFGKSKSSISESNILSCEASQSSKNDEHFPLPSVPSCSTSKNDFEVCRKSSNLGEQLQEISNEFTDACESSEDIKLDIVISTSEMCTSSDKLADNVRAEHSSNKVCDSVSEDIITIKIEKNGKILKSENSDINNIEKASEIETNSSFSATLLISLDTVNVSSSVDINPNVSDVIYSSSVPNSSARKVSSKPVTPEATQSSTRSNTSASCSSLPDHSHSIPDVENYNEAVCKKELKPSLLKVSDMKSTDSLKFDHDGNLVLKSDDVSSLSADQNRISYVTRTFSEEDGNISSQNAETENQKNNFELVESSFEEDSGDKTKLRDIKPTTSAVTNLNKKDFKMLHHKLKLHSRNSGTFKEKERDSVSVSEVEPSRKRFDISEFKNSDAPGVMTKEHSLPSNVASSSTSVMDSAQSSIDSRPSLLEVIVSSASDFRNSLIHENSNFGRNKNKSSSVEEATESSLCNIDVPDELTEAVIGDAVGCSSEQTESTIVTPSDSFLQENDLKINRSKFTDSEVTGSFDSEEKTISSELSQQVTQSTEIVNTHSSTCGVLTILSEDNESSQRDFVQSSTNISNVSAFSSLNESGYMLAHVSSADENQLVSDMSKHAEIPDSETFGQIIESSDNGQSLYENKISFHRAENVESEVSSSPCDINHTRLDTVSSDGSGQCSVIEGSLLNSATCETVIKSDDISGDVIVTSVNRDSLFINSNLSENSDLRGLNKVTASHIDKALCSSSKSLEDKLNCESSYENRQNTEVTNHDEAGLSDVIESSNEAEILKHSSFSSTVNMECNEDSSLPSSIPEVTMTVPHVILETVVSSSPINEVEIVVDRYIYDRSDDTYQSKDSCEVSESFTDNKNDVSESFADENKVSCSASEYSTDSPFYKNYTFNENEFCSLPSHEVATKSDACVSSHDADVSDDSAVLMQTMSQPSTSNIELSMYTNVADFESDSVQSSSLEESQFIVSEPIKAVSSSPVFSDSCCYEEQTALNSSSFISLPSEVHFISSDSCDLSLNKTPSNASNISFAHDVAPSHFISSCNETSCTKANSEHVEDSDFTDVVSQSINENSSSVNEVTGINVNADVEFWGAEENFQYSEVVVSESPCEEIENSSAVDSTDSINNRSGENDLLSTDFKSPSSTSQS